jgi:hypothetical protein
MDQISRTLASVSPGQMQDVMMGMKVSEQWQVVQGSMIAMALTY